MPSAAPRDRRAAVRGVEARGAAWCAPGRALAHERIGPALRVWRRRAPARRGDQHPRRARRRMSIRERERRTPRLKRVVVGRPMASDEIDETLLPKWLALPIFASDPLSSVAYATEAG